MKNVIIASGLVLIIILTIFTSLTIYSNNSRQNEVEEALAMAVEQSLENLKLEQEYEIHNEKEFVADFVQRLVIGLNSKSEIKVNVLAVDMDKGLLDVEVVEEYRQPNGTVGSASYRKTVILDEVVVKNAKLFSVTFMVEKGYGTGNFEAYKTFSISEGQNVIFPGADPSMEGHAFKGWSQTEPTASNGYTPPTVDEDTEISPDQDLVYYAVFE